MKQSNFRIGTVLTALTVLLIWGRTTAFAQILDPVKWEFAVHETETNNEIDVVFHASVEACWHIYSQFLDDPNGPLPTYFEVEVPDGVEKVGKVVECDPLVKYDPNFMMDLKFFEEEVYWVQTVRVNPAAVSESVTGFLSFMVCDESRCLPPEDIEFSIALNEVLPALPNYCPEPEHICGDHATSAPTQIEDSESGILEPVTWDVNIYENGEAFELVFHAQIDPCWHTYSQYLERFDGPMPTAFRIDWPEGFEAVGDVTECDPLIQFDPTFEMDVNMFEEEVYFIQSFTGPIDESEVITGAITFMACDEEKCVFPPDLDFEAPFANRKKAPKRPDYCPPLQGLCHHGKDEAAIAEGPNKAEEEGLAGVFFLGMLLGFAALLTPCVFPMIPMTVSFFTKQSKTRSEGIRNALIYGFFIILIYTGLGLMLTAIFGVDILNVISTDPFFNLFLFALLIVFGFSFLGAFEIQLPTSWANTTDQAADRGGIIGIFFMAATLAIVSFSCTGPLVGSALAGAATGSFAAPTAVMFGFSLALALPFMLFSAFPGWLNSLPQSGGWLNSVKVVLGLLEIGFAFKFLSNADMVLQLGLLKRELFIAIWILTAVVTAFYLLGWIRFWHDSKTQKIGKQRIALGIAFLAFAGYMTPGLWGEDIKAISGFPPGMDYSYLEIHHVKALHLDYDEGLKAATEAGKPVVLDFTGWACVNCRKMEEQVWPNPRVMEILENEVVLVSLYVDERVNLPEEEQGEEQYGGKTFKIKTVGNKWSYMQASKFNTNSQPFYVMLDHDGAPLGEGVGYDPDASKFVEFLESGLAAFNR